MVKVRPQGIEDLQGGFDAAKYVPLRDRGHHQVEAGTALRHGRPWIDRQDLCNVMVWRGRGHSLLLAVRHGQFLQAAAHGLVARQSRQHAGRGLGE